MYLNIYIYISTYTNIYIYIFIIYINIHIDINPHPQKSPWHCPEVPAGCEPPVDHFASHGLRGVASRP